MGLSSLEFIFDAEHVAEGETSNQVEYDQGASIECTNGPPDYIKTHVAF